MATTDDGAVVSASIGFGIGLPVVQQVPAKVRAWERDAGPAEIERVARAADRLGFAHVACSDHVVVPRSYAPAMGATWYDAISTLAYLGGMTQRIELLTHVLVLPYHHPLVLAKSLATLDAMTRGRLVVGVGSGHLKPGVQEPRRPVRRARGAHRRVHRRPEGPLDRGGSRPSREGGSHFMT